MTEIKLLNVIRSLEVLSDLLQTYEGSDDSSIFYCNKFNYTGICSFDCNNDKFSQCKNQAKEKLYIDIQRDGIYYATSSYVFLNKTPDIFIQKLVNQSKIIDIYLPQLYLDFNNNFDIFQEFYVIYQEKTFLRIYPSMEANKSYFESIYENYNGNWFYETMKIPIDSKFIFSDFLKDQNTTVLSKPFFGKDNEIKGKLENINKNYIIGVVAASIDLSSIFQRFKPIKSCADWKDFFFKFDERALVSNSNMTIRTLLEKYECAINSSDFNSIESFNIFSKRCLDKQSSSKFIDINILAHDVLEKNPFIYIATCDEINYTSNKVKTDLSFYLNTYFLVFSILILFFLIFVKYHSKRFVREYINPIKQISYTINRLLKSLFYKKNLKKMIDENVIIKEKTEIKEISDIFMRSFKEIYDNKIISHDIGTIQKIEFDKEKMLRNKISERMIDSIQEVIDTIPDS